MDAAVAAHGRSVSRWNRLNDVLNDVMAEFEFTRTGAAEWSHPLLALLGSSAVGCFNVAFCLVHWRGGKFPSEKS